jgi:hypothetical protein
MKINTLTLIILILALNTIKSETYCNLFYSNTECTGNFISGASLCYIENLCYTDSKTKSTINYVKDTNYCTITFDQESCKGNNVTSCVSLNLGICNSVTKYKMVKLTDIKNTIVFNSFSIDQCNSTIWRNRMHVITELKICSFQYSQNNYFNFDYVNNNLVKNIYSDSVCSVLNSTTVTYSKGCNDMVFQII